MKPLKGLAIALITASTFMMSGCLNISASLDPEVCPNLICFDFNI